MHHIRTFSCGLGVPAGVSVLLQSHAREENHPAHPPPLPIDPQPPPPTPVPIFYIHFPHRYSVFSHGATSKAQKRSRTRLHKTVRRATWVSCSVRVQAGRYPSRPPPLWPYPPPPIHPPTPTPTLTHTPRGCLLRQYPPITHRGQAFVPTLCFTSLIRDAPTVSEKSLPNGGTSLLRPTLRNQAHGI